MRALDRAGDPRGGVQARDYRFARPEVLVDAEGTAMSGPGGAPEDPLDTEQCRARERD